MIKMMEVQHDHEPDDAVNLDHQQLFLYFAADSNSVIKETYIKDIDHFACFL